MASVDIRFVCILDNLALATTDESLKHTFSRFGEIIVSKVSEDLVTGRSKRCGYVIFKEQGSLRDAIDEMDGKELDGKTITVKMAAEIRDGFGNYAAGPFGFDYDAGGPLPFGFGYDDGDPLPFDYYGGSLPLGFCSDGYGCRSTVTKEVGFGCIVSNLALTTTDDSIGRVFSEFGEIIQSKVSRDHRNDGKLVATVTFKERRSVRDAMDGMNGKELDGEKIRIYVAHVSDHIVRECGRCECGFLIAPR